MNADESHLAEDRRAGESWQEMILRQQKEKENPDKWMRERLRSLPQEEQEKAKEQSLFTPANDNSPVVEATNVAWLEQLCDAAQRGEHHQYELER